MFRYLCAFYHRRFAEQLSCRGRYSGKRAKFNTYPLPRVNPSKQDTSPEVGGGKCGNPSEYGGVLREYNENNNVNDSIHVAPDWLLVPFPCCPPLRMNGDPTSGTIFQSIKQ